MRRDRVRAASPAAFLAFAGCTRRELPSAAVSAGLGSGVTAQSAGDPRKVSARIPGMVTALLRPVRGAVLTADARPRPCVPEAASVRSGVRPRALCSRAGLARASVSSASVRRCPCGRPARARPGVIPSTAAGRRPSAVPVPVPPPAAAAPRPRQEDPHCAQARQPLPPRLADRARVVGGHGLVCGLSLAGVVSRSAGCLALSLRRVLRCADFTGPQSPWLRLAALALALEGRV